MGLTAILAVIEAATALLPELAGLTSLIQSNAAGEAFTDTELAQLDSIAQSLNAKAAALAASEAPPAPVPTPVPPAGAE